MATVTTERTTAAADGTGRPAGVGPVVPSGPEGAPPLTPGRKLVLRASARWRAAMDPAMAWVQSTMDGPLRGLRTEFGRLLLIMVVVVILSANAVWFLESKAGNAAFSPAYVVGIGDALWYVIVTMATVGYGDKTPVTAGGRAVSSILILASVVLVSLFTATASSLLVARRIKEGDDLDAETLNGHTIVCGWNRNMPRFLAALSRGGERVVVLINEATSDVIETHLKAYANLKILFVRGSFTQESILAEAAIKQASHAVIVPDESGSSTEQVSDEQKTVLASLVIKEMAPQVRVIAHVLKREDAAHVKRAKVDEVIVTDEFTGELLANHVANPGAPQALAEIMSVETPHGIRAIPIPAGFIGGTLPALVQHLKDQHLLLLGFAVREQGFGLNQAMRGGSDFITEFIQQQVQAAGISMSTDEHIVVRLNPPDDFVINSNHSALVLA